MGHPRQGAELDSDRQRNTSEFTNVIPAFAAANPRNGDGQDLFNTPPYNWRLDVNYQKSVGLYDVFANASATAVGRARNSDATVNTLDPYQLYRASVGVRKGAYEVKLFGENLSDERGPTAANGPTLLAGPRPRTIGVNLSLDFN